MRILKPVRLLLQSVTLKGGILNTERLFLQLIAKTTLYLPPPSNVAVCSERVIWNTLQHKTSSIELLLLV